MKLDTPYRCDGDGCGTLKQPSNHWLMIWIDIPNLLSGTPEIRVSPWRNEKADEEGVAHACGDECALRITGKLLQVLRRQLVKEAAETASH